MEFELQDISKEYSQLENLLMQYAEPLKTVEAELVKIEKDEIKKQFQLKKEEGMRVA